MYNMVFISHAREDREIAEKLFDFLSSNRYDPWMDKKKILPGQTWDLEITSALDKADYIILVFSKISVSKRGYVQKEFSDALRYCEEKLDSDIFIIPCKIDDCEIPKKFQKYQWVELNEPDSFKEILEALNLQREKYIKWEKEKQPKETDKKKTNNKKWWLMCGIVAIALLFLGLWFSNKPPPKDEIIPSVEKETSWLEKYNMIEVVFDHHSTAYTNISNDVQSKKNLLRNFHIGKYQITQEEWQEIMNNNPSFFKGEKKLPVESVSWYDCIEFCNKLSEKYGLRKYYNINGTDVSLNTGANGFRLPTEAEWEYAARGGINSKNYKFAGCNTEQELKFYAWYYENSDKKTHPVGQLKPNELGLYDMIGNVFEWCEDKYSENSSYRVIRGGSWDNLARGVRVSNRDYDTHDSRYYNLGFRLAFSSN